MNAVTETKADHKTIFAALAAAQMEMGKAIKDTKNEHFRSKYADLASVMDACLGALNRNGICVIQPTGENENGVRFVETILAHSSGETVSCRVPLIVNKNDMQGYGSAVTYARRYGLMSMAGIAPEDDDGNAAAKAAPKEDRVIAPVSDALRQAREDAVMDALPDAATPRQKAEAYAESLIAEFKACTGDRALNNRWHRDEKALAAMQERFPDLFEKVGEAYDTRMNELTEGVKA